MPYFRLERPRPLLQHRDLPKAVGLTSGEDLLRGEHVAMRAADAPEAVGVSLLEEIAHGVGAQQRERVLRRELVPQLLERNGALDIALFEQHVDHLAVC